MSFIELGEASLLCCITSIQMLLKPQKQGMMMLGATHNHTLEQKRQSNFQAIRKHLIVHHRETATIFQKTFPYY